MLSALAIALNCAVLPVDSTTLRGKVIAGYQAWFRVPKDGAKQGWVHWSRDSNVVSPETVTFEMWPKVDEYPSEAVVKAGTFTFADGQSARLYAADHPGVIDVHFRWMKEYGIDGVFVQRFVSHIRSKEASRVEAQVLRHVRNCAEKYGRIFAVEYDMSGVPPEESLSLMQGDWKYLSEELKLTESARYLRHNGNPVLGMFGFFTDRMSGQQANQIIDAFPSQKVSLVGAGQWWWRRETDADWSRAFRRFAAYSPWDVGNTGSTSRWKEDLEEAQREKMLLLPVLYPGFSWDNLQRKDPGTSLISRRRGAFFKKQFEEAANLKIGQAFIAMFDEVDEGTAIFKIEDKPPVQGHFVGLDGLPSDAYLRMAGEGTKLIRDAGY